MSTKSSIAVWSLVILVASMLLAPNSLFSWESPENIDNFGGGYYLPTSKALTSFIYVKSWKPEKTPKAVVVFVHGLGEHIGRYEHVFSEFARQGLLTVGYDTRGFGRSSGPRGGAPTLDELFDDIELVYNHARIAGVKTFLFGHSLGGLTVLSFVAKRGDKVKFDGVVASAPAVGQVFEVNPLIKIVGQAVSSVPFLKNIAVPTDIPQEGITKDPTVVKSYQNDPYVHGKIALVFANSIFSYQDWMIAEGCKNLKIPLLITHGDKDILTSFPASKKCFEQVPSKDKTFQPFPGGYHELHNDEEKDEVIKLYASWFLDRAPVKA